MEGDPLLIQAEQKLIDAGVPIVYAGNTTGNALELQYPRLVHWGGFALAVLMCQLLLEGVHPFAGGEGPQKTADHLLRVAEAIDGGGVEEAVHRDRGGDDADLPALFLGGGDEFDRYPYFGGGGSARGVRN